MRAEFEIINSRVNYNEGGSSMYTSVTNLYYTQKFFNEFLVPYVCIGMGFGIKFGEKELEELEKSFPLRSIPIPVLAYQGKLGINCRLTQKVNVLIGYRYFSGFAIFHRMFGHNVEFGMSYNF